VITTASPAEITYTIHPENSDEVLAALTVRLPAGGESPAEGAGL